MEDNHNINARTWTNLDTVTYTFYFLIACVFLAGCCLGAVGITCYNKILELTQDDVVIRPATFVSHNIAPRDNAPLFPDTEVSLLNRNNYEQNNDVHLQGVIEDAQYDESHY